MPQIAGIPLTAVIGEFVGTFLLVFTIGCNVLGNNAIWGAISIACVLMVSIYALGTASGAHFNPAVTLALQLARKLDLTGGWTQVIVYCISQLCGGLTAAFCYTMLFERAFPVAPKQGHQLGAVICELFYTFMLCFVVLNVAASKAKGGRNQYFGLAIGFVIIAGGYSAGPVGAGFFNPAVALSVFVSSISAGMGGDVVAVLLYLAAELMGAALAVGVFVVMRPEEGDMHSQPPNSVRGQEYPLQCKLMSEFVGTFMLVLTVGLNVLGGSPAGAFSIAMALTCMIYAVGDISGGHFNPAVTLAIHLRNKDTANIKDDALYVAAQLAGGIIAAFTYALVHNGRTFPLGPGAGHSWGNVAVAELVFTFVLAFVVLGVATLERKPAEDFIGFIIGMTVTAGGFAIGSVSGGCLNPAVSIGIAAAHIMGGGFFFKALFYTAFQLVGGVIAAALFLIIYKSPPTREGMDWVKICASEFTGTFLLVLTVGCNVLTNTGKASLWGGVSIASVLMCSIYAFANASGGHLNPAVTAGLAMAGRLQPGTPVLKQCTLYMMSQMCGGLMAALAYYSLFNSGFHLKATPGYEIGAHICELLYTFMLVFVVLNTAASKAKGGKNQYFGLAIGFVVIAGAYGAGPLGAGCFNPAVAFGVFAAAPFKGDEHELVALGRCALFICVELMGAALAAAMFILIRPEEKTQHGELPDAPAGSNYNIESKLLSEFVGTFMLVFTVGLNVLGGSKAGAFSIAAALTSMIYATGDVSGGHFNPAVTLAIHGCGKDDPNFAEAAYYMLAQLLGGIVAAFTYSLCYNGVTFPLGPGLGHGWGGVAAAEIMYTFVLASVVLCVAVVRKQQAPDFVGFIIGSCVTVGGLAIGGISGGCLNPAVAVGIAASQIMNGGFFFKALLYAAFELFGGALAAVLFRVIYGGALDPELHKLPVAQPVYSAARVYET
jgi:aquaporin Z